MNYKELLKKNNFNLRCHMSFSSYCEESMKEFQRNADDAENKLKSLGDNLTQDDYEEVSALYTILERNTCAMCSMSVVNMTIEERDEIMIRLAKEFQSGKYKDLYK